MTHIPASLRQAVSIRARDRCEYCQTQQHIVITMEVDHIIPLSAGGKTLYENLCLSCAICNGFKLDTQTGVDPITNTEVLLFNPRQQNWDDHFRWDDNLIAIVGRTSIGRATIARLHMNDLRVVSARRLWVSAGWHPPAD